MLSVQVHGRALTDPAHPPPLHSNRPCIVIGGGGVREPPLSVLQLSSEGRILSFSYAFAGWTRWYYRCIAVHFRFLASRATPLYPVSCRTLQFFASSAMAIDHIDTRVHQKVTVMGQVLQGQGHVQLFRVKYCRQKKWSKAEHAPQQPNRQSPAHLVVRMPSCLHDLFCIARPLHTNRRGRGNRHLGYVPWGGGGEDAVPRR